MSRSIRLVPSLLAALPLLAQPVVTRPLAAQQPTAGQPPAPRDTTRRPSRPPRGEESGTPRAGDRGPLPVTAATATLDSTTVAASGALKARSIGPGVMGGRVAALALDPTDPWTFYVGLATGGLMKTTNNGATFTPLFDKQPVAAIGDVAVAPSDAKVLWVGTGEANDRNSVSWGNGVYRSVDGGSTWAHVGLGTSRAIARVIPHPTDTATAWVCAAGSVWTPGGERGVYKTTDAGRSWRRVLGAAAPYDDRVGCSDLAADARNPNVLYAALYARRRRPWSFVSGASATDGRDLGGVFKSVDGGQTWTKLTGGLPARTQRIGLAVFAADPNVVYAEVQSDAAGPSGIDDPYSKAGGVFRSSDGGATWTRTSRLNPRPFYFSQIRVDPKNDSLVYVLGYVLHVSEDQGRSWREDRFKNVHVDNHALVIDPRSPKRMIIGNDGGVYQSYDRGATWTHHANMAIGEFYRVNADMSRPYRLCGGLQDNSNWVGPSATASKDGVVDATWTQIGGGDGSYCVFDGADSNVVYSESQQGYIQRTNLATGEIKNLRPEPAEGSPAFRFHWASPLIASRHEKGVLWYGANRVFRLTDRGQSWTVVSPDLTTNDPQKTTAIGSGAEDYGTIYTLAESPVKAGVLWAGTDDGKLWVTEDGAATWRDLTASLPAAARGKWVSRVEPGAHDAGTAYVAFDAHRDGVYAPLAYRTSDGGRTWTSIVGDLPAEGPVKVVRESPTSADVLFAGTEFGLFASVDRGAHWFRVGGLPTVAVDDILVHPRDHDLIVATHGRGLWVLDDVRALEELTPAVRASAAHLFAPSPALARDVLPGWVESAGSAEFRGANPPPGASLTYWVRRWTGDGVSLAIADAAGRPVANLTAPGTPGLNRLTWDLKPTKDVLTEYGGEGQKYVRAGDYTVTLTYGSVTEKRTLHVDVAPGIETR